MPTDRKWSVLFAIGVGTFMTALDSSVANTVLPVIGRSFHADVDTVEWVVTVYLLGISGLLLTFGRLGDLRGHRSVYLWGFGVFVSASALCGLAPSVASLVAFRAVQAIGAAMLMANSPAILTKHFPSSQRGQALGIQATMTYLGLCAGPSLGGWLTGHFGWRTVFYVNIPVGLAALVLSLRYVGHDRPVEKSQPQPFDLVGAATFMAGLVALCSPSTKATPGAGRALRSWGCWQWPLCCWPCSWPLSVGSRVRCWTWACFRSGPSLPRP